MRTIVALCACAAVAACDPGPPTKSGEMPSVLRAKGLVSLRSDLERVVDKRQTFAIVDAWRGRWGRRCGLIGLDDGTKTGKQTTARFFERKNERSENAIIVEQRPAWNAAEWLAQCGVRNAELMPEPDTPRT